jgi:seryl-tRNA synthetase
LSEHVIELDSPLTEVLANEFAKRVFYATEEIRGFRLIADENNKVNALAVTVDGATLPEGLVRKLRFVLDNDVAPQLARPPKVVWRSTVRRIPEADTFARLVDRRMATPVGEGQVALSSAFLGVMDDLDRLIMRLLAREFDIEEFRYPTLIPVEVLHRCGYFTSFPQYVMLTTRLRADVDNYREFLEEAKATRDIGAGLLDRCDRVDYCLPPTMCYHTFNHYGGATLPTQLSTVTARGKSFRHESRYHRSLARLWDFTIREIVFLGSRAEVLDARERFLNLVLGLVDDWGLSGRCEVASDPFFCNSDSGMLASSQRLLELKYELQLDLAEADSVAVASFNFHDRFFAESFEIGRQDESQVYSGCVGFGLERLSFALMCQYGLDRRTWPSSLLAALDQPGQYLDHRPAPARVGI